MTASAAGPPSSPSRVERRIVGTCADDPGRSRVSVSGYVLTSAGLEVEVWEHGARLVGVFAPDRDGKRANVVLRHPTLDDYTGHDHAYFGATIGRYANRIANGRLQLGDRQFQLSVNEGRHQLHGGSVGFDQHVWETVAVSNDSVTFRHVSSDGDQGFPGEVSVEVTYALAGTQLSIDTVAVTDADTVFGSTNHAYWNLAGGGTIADHNLSAPASRFVEIDDDLIPTGRLGDVEGSRFDFSTSEPLAPLVASGGIDHCLVYADGAARAQLSHPESGRIMTIDSDQPGMQVYTGQYLPDPFSGMCLEPQQLPDTPNHPAFGSSLLRPGETYRHRATYTFGLMPS